MQEAFNAMLSNSAVTVSDGQWLVFEPASANYTTGFIFYPGGRVDYRSYAPLAYSVAKAGYLAVIVPMPLNLAIFGVNGANNVIETYPNVTKWVISGHSLGGSMAAQFTYDNPDKIKGLILMATYPASGLNLSRLNLEVLTIHGTNDGLVSATQIANSLEQLPLSALRVQIEGGNHAQFGWYGSQAEDNDATISREQQQNQTLNAIIPLLKRISG